MLDTAIATLDCKVAWNGARPEPFIKYYFRGETIQSWGGRGRGAQAIKGEDFPALPFHIGIARARVRSQHIRGCWGNGSPAFYGQRRLGL